MRFNSVVRSASSWCSLALISYAGGERTGRATTGVAPARSISARGVRGIRLQPDWLRLQPDWLRLQADLLAWDPARAHAFVGSGFSRIDCGFSRIGCGFSRILLA
jgi:hypothetical protein